MANRRTLHKTQLEEFKRYLEGRGIAYRKGKGSYQALQVMTLNNGWQCVYERNDMKEHFTIQDKLESIVIGFYSEKRERLHVEHDKKVEKLHAVEKYLDDGPEEIWNDRSLLADWIFLGIESGAIKGE